MKIYRFFLKKPNKRLKNVKKVEENHWKSVSAPIGTFCCTHNNRDITMYLNRDIALHFNRDITMSPNNRLKRNKRLK